MAVPFRACPWCGTAERVMVSRGGVATTVSSAEEVGLGKLVLRG